MKSLKPRPTRPRVAGTAHERRARAQGARRTPAVALVPVPLLAFACLPFLSPFSITGASGRRFGPLVRVFVGTCAGRATCA